MKKKTRRQTIFGTQIIQLNFSNVYTGGRILLPKIRLDKKKIINKKKLQVIFNKL